METINLWSILVASVVAFAISAVWYSPILFGKEWMSLLGYTEKDIAETKKKGLTKSYVIQFIMTIITFIVIAFVISALNAQNVRDGAFIGLIAWVGFIVPVTVSCMLWEKSPLKLVLIDSIAMLICWIVGGAIIGAW